MGFCYALVWGKEVQGATLAEREDWWGHLPQLPVQVQGTTLVWMGDGSVQGEDWLGHPHHHYRHLPRSTRKHPIRCCMNHRPIVSLYKRKGSLHPPVWRPQSEQVAQRLHRSNPTERHRLF